MFIPNSNETNLLQNEKYVPNQVQSAFITKALHS